MSDKQIIPPKGVCMIPTLLLYSDCKDCGFYDTCTNARKVERLKEKPTKKSNRIIKPVE